MKKRLLTLALALALTLTLLPGAVAAGYEARHMGCADALYELGLFRGTGTLDGKPVYELERTATRTEALVMLIRLLGEEADALACAEKHPFADVPEGHWAYNYVAYAYKTGYTKGLSADEFGVSGEATAIMYLTFLLRALGYDDAAGDFSYGEAWKKAAEVGIIKSGEYSDGAAFYRDDCAYASFNALSARLKGGEKTLRQALEEKGAIPAGENKLIPMPSFADNYGEFDASGRLVRSVSSGYWGNDYSFTTLDYSYGEDGRLVSVERRMAANYYDGGFGGISRVVLVYDGSGLPVGEEHYYDDEPDGSAEYSYENDGSRLVITLDGYDYCAERGELLGALLPESVTSAVVYENGEILESLRFDENGLLGVYNGAGMPARENVYSDGKLVKSISFTYASAGVGGADIGSGANSETVTEYSYNADGDLVSCVSGEASYTFTYSAPHRLSALACTAYGETTEHTVSLNPDGTLAVYVPA